MHRRTLLAATLAAPAAWAQGAYPTRSVRIIVGHAPGGATDITSRILAEAMAPRFPAGMVIENRTGAGGNIAAETVARAAPDGYTLGIADASITAINPVIYRRLAFDPATDFTPVALLDDFPFMIVCHPSVPVRDIAGFVAWAKAQPDPVQYASPAPGSQHHLGMEILAQRAGFRVQHIGFRGGAQATTALLAGQMPAGSIGLPPLIPHLRSGGLRGLAISGPQRSALLPDIPTIAETVAPGLSMTVWYGLIGPRGLPAEVLRHLGDAVAEALRDPEVVGKLAAQGLSAHHLPAEAFASFLAREREVWGAAARSANLTLD